MLKKLAKHGNSTTLVIDKAILELLNMDESSTVKLQTDGKSLIITPVSNAAKGKVTYTTEESMNYALAAFKSEATKKWENQSAEKKAEIEKMIPAMTIDFQKVFEKYPGVVNKFAQDIASNKEFQAAVEQLTQKYDPVDQPVEYSMEFKKLEAAFFPEMTALKNEIDEITKKYSE
jgi:antitoxin component of MazEF toxin-antitoxin module